jgi:ppGpp synthetase/RelA/SpoT-type nucleotidyltranferase
VEMADESEDVSEFNFSAHRESAVAKYREIRPLYLDFAEAAKVLIADILKSNNVKYSSIEARAKDVDSFGKKASKSLESDPTKPKYPNPLEEIKDMAGVRVITFLPQTVEYVCSQVEREFLVLEKVDKAERLKKEVKLGYQSVHFLLKMLPDRSELPEYQRYNDLVLEIQVRTILQHAWAEMEHDIQYKSTMEIPILFQRRFIALAGLLEIADREFQMLQDESERKKQEKDKEINEHIENLRKLIAEGSSDDKEYAIEALKDLNLQLEREVR